MKYRFILLPLLFLTLFILFNSCSNKETKIPLTNEEQIWLNEHNGKVTLCSDPKYPPIEWIDNTGHYVGYSPDIFDIIEKKLNFKFNRVYIASSWSELIQASKEKRVDVISAIVPNKDRENFLLFTQGYIDASIVYITRKDANGNINLENPENKTITTIDGYSVHKYLVDKYPNLILDLVPDINSGLQKLAFKGTDVLIVDFPTAFYYIEKEGYSNLKIAGKLDYTHNLAIGSRKDWPILNTILSKALTSISPEEKYAVYNKWIHLDVDIFSIYKPLFRIILIIGLIIITIITGFIWWNRTLKREVKQRTEEIEKAKHELEEKVKERTYELQSLNMEMAAKNEQLQLLNSTKDKFFSIISHDLRSPFLALRGFADNLVNNFSTLSDEQKVRFSKHIQNSANSLYALTDNLLLWARAQSGVIKINKDTFILVDLVDKVFALLKNNTLEKNISLIHNIDKNVLIYADHNAVITILTNLIANAIKFSGNNTSVTVEVEEKEYIYFIAVSDSGIGMSNEDIEKLFKPGTDYQTIGNNNKQKGTGLGLMICKELVELNGGTIMAESELGKGTSIIFSVDKAK